MILFLFIVSLLEVLYDNIDCYVFYYQMRGQLNWLIEKKTAKNYFCTDIFLFYIR